MSSKNTDINELIGQVVIKVTQLSEEDLPLVIEFVDYLVQQRQAVLAPSLSVAEMRAKARERAKALSNVPRAEIVARFQELTEDIRQTATIKNTAIKGDWLGD